LGRTNLPNIHDDRLQSTIDAHGRRARAHAPVRLRTRDASPSDRRPRRGRLRVAEKVGGTWTTHQWIKKAVLLSFRLTDTAAMRFERHAGSAEPFAFYDKVPSKFTGLSDEALAAAGVRVVPPAVARRGAYLAKNVV
jgi:2,3,4,5-tetrahydropyridine-2,6-dicarboxylate N-succinyltransferase